jgi:hypothetical protein
MFLWLHRVPTGRRLRSINILYRAADGRTTTNFGPRFLHKRNIVIDPLQLMIYLRHVRVFFGVLRFPPPTKLTI